MAIVVSFEVIVVVVVVVVFIADYFPWQRFVPLFHSRVFPMLLDEQVHILPIVNRLSPMLLDQCFRFVSDLGANKELVLVRT